MDDKHVSVSISTSAILKVLAVILLVWFLIAIKQIVLLLLISVIIASAIAPLADFLQKHRIPRGLSVLVVYAFFIGILVLVGVLMAPAISDQFQQISQSNFLDQFQAKLGVYKENFGSTSLGQTIEDNVKNLAGNISETLFNTTKGLVTGFFSIVTVLVISFYLTVEENGMKNFIKHLTPYKHQAYAAKLITKIQKKMGSWVLGQLILSAVVFGLTYLGLTLLHVDYALVLALIAGILEIIPYIGPFLSPIPAIFFAFLQGPALAVAVLVLYILVQQIENHVLVPVVMSKSVGLNPVMVILGILVGGTLGGVVGAVIAVPVISGIAVFVSDMFEAGVPAPELDGKS